MTPKTNKTVSIGEKIPAITSTTSVCVWGVNRSQQFPYYEVGMGLLWLSFCVGLLVYIFLS